MERRRLIIIAMIVVVILLVATLWTFLVKDVEDDQLMSEQIDYVGNLTGSNVSVPIYYNYTLGWENGTIDDMFSISTWGSVPGFSVLNQPCVEPYYPIGSDVTINNEVAFFLGDSFIDTRFGKKWVHSYISLQGHRDQAIMLEVGVDSSITYRWTVASLNNSYNYQFALNVFNNTDIYKVDNKQREWSILGFNIPTTEPYGHHVAGPGVSTYGTEIFRIDENQSLHYKMVGHNTRAFVLDLNDLRKFGETGSFTYDLLLSKTGDDVVFEINAMADPGFYLVFMNIGTSDVTVINDIEPYEEVNGYMVRYWAPEEN